MSITIACLGERYNLHRDESIVDQFAGFSFSPKTNFSELTYKATSLKIKTMLQLL